MSTPMLPMGKLRHSAAKEVSKAPCLLRVGTGFGLSQASEPVVFTPHCSASEEYGGLPEPQSRTENIIDPFDELPL